MTASSARISRDFMVHMRERCTYRRGNTRIFLPVHSGRHCRGKPIQGIRITFASPTPGPEYIAMTIIKINKYHSLKCDIDTILQALLLAFPRSEITSDDSFETQRIWVREFIKRRAREGRPVNSTAALLGTIDNKEVYYGKAKDIIIRVKEDCVVKGWVTSINTLLRSNCSFPNPGIDSVVNVLKSLNLGAVQVYPLPEPGR